MTHSPLARLRRLWLDVHLWIGVGLLNRKIFSLPGEQLRFILGVHLTRITICTLLSGLVWHCALPAVPLSMWFLLAALQLLVTRLPFVPNKDLVFANAALLIAAVVLYIPANLLPVLHTTSLVGNEDDTIMSGVVFFWTSGDWPLSASARRASLRWCSHALCRRTACCHRRFRSRSRSPRCSPG